MTVSSAANAATALSQAQLGQEVAVRVAKKQQDVTKQQGAAAIDLLNRAAQNQQQLFAAEPFKGTQLDVVA